MAETIEVPLSLLQKIAEVTEAFQLLEDELEDYLISTDEQLLSRLSEARRDHLAGRLRSFSEIRGNQ